jgi:hypothetical protein
VQGHKGTRFALYVSGFGMVVGYVFVMANNFELHRVCDSQWQYNDL